MVIYQYKIHSQPATISVQQANTCSQMYYIHNMCVCVFVKYHPTNKLTLATNENPIKIQ